MSETFEVYDKRDQPFYIVDDVFLKRFGKVIGPNGIAVYNALCMHSNKKTGESWPSRESIHELTGLSVRAISTAIKQLASLKLIKIVSTTGGPNHYFIQPVPEKAELMHHVQAPTLAPRARGIARPASPIAPVATPLARGASEQEPLTITKNKKQKQEIAASAAPPPNPEPVETEAPKSNPTPSKPKVNGKERPTPTKTEPLTAGGPKRTPAELARANAIVDRLEVRCKTSRKIASSGLYDVAWKILGINPDEDGTGIDTAYGDPPPDIPRTQWNWWLHDYRGRGDPEKNRPPDYPKHYQVLETYLVSREPVRVSLKLVTSNKSRGTPGANGDPNIDGIAQARARYEARENKHNGPIVEGRVIHG